jgi:hypothetical protein
VQLAVDAFGVEALGVEGAAGPNQAGVAPGSSASGDLGLA